MSRIGARQIARGVPPLKPSVPYSKFTRNDAARLLVTNRWAAPRAHSTSSTPKSYDSVNASEVSHFTQLASSWWDPHGPSRLLHLMNPLRHDFIRMCLATTPESLEREPAGIAEKSTYLDIGCGGGIFASSAARLPTTASVVAIDPTTEVIKVAKAHQRTDPLLAQPGRLTYLNCAIEELHSQKELSTQTTQEFDFVSLFEVIEHIDRPAAFLRQALSHVKPGGWLVGSTIARHPLSYLTTKVVAEAPWPVGVVPPGTHDWNKYINPAEIQGWFAKDELRNLAEQESSAGSQPFNKYGKVIIEGCIYLPLMGWKFVHGSEQYGNYFFGVQKLR